MVTLQQPPQPFFQFPFRSQSAHSLRNHRSKYFSRPRPQNTAPYLTSPTFSTTFTIGSALNCITPGEDDTLTPLGPANRPASSMSLPAQPHQSQYQQSTSSNISEQKALEILQRQLATTVRNWVQNFESFSPNYNPTLPIPARQAQLILIDQNLARCSATFACLLTAFSTIYFRFRIGHPATLFHDLNEPLELFRDPTIPLPPDAPRIKNIEEAVGMWREYNISTIQILSLYSNPDAFNPERCKNEMTRMVARAEEIYHAIQYFLRPRQEGEREGYHPKWDLQKKPIKNPEEQNWVNTSLRDYIDALELHASDPQTPVPGIGNPKVNKLRKKHTLSTLTLTPTQNKRNSIRHMFSRSKNAVRNIFFDVSPTSSPTTIPPNPTSRLKYLSISPPIPLSPVTASRFQPLPSFDDRLDPIEKSSTTEPHRHSALRNATRNTRDTDTTLVNAFDSLDLHRSPKLGRRPSAQHHSQSYPYQEAYKPLDPPPQVFASPELERELGMGRTPTIPAQQDIRLPTNPTFIPPLDDQEDPYINLRHESRRSPSSHAPEQTQERDPFDDILAAYRDSYQSFPADEEQDEEEIRHDGVEAYLHDQIDFGSTGRRDSNGGWSFARSESHNDGHLDASSNDTTTSAPNQHRAHNNATPKDEDMGRKSKKGELPHYNKLTKKNYPHDPFPPGPPVRSSTSTSGQLPPPPTRTVSYNPTSLSDTARLRALEEEEKELANISLQKAQLERERQELVRKQEGLREREREGRERYEQWQRKRDEAQWKPDGKLVPGGKAAGDRKGMLNGGVQAGPSRYAGRGYEQQPQFTRAQTQPVGHAARGSAHQAPQKQKMARMNTQPQQRTPQPSSSRPVSNPRSQTQHQAPHPSRPDLRIPGSSYRQPKSRKQPNTQPPPNTNKPLPIPPDPKIDSPFDYVMGELKGGERFPLNSEHLDDGFRVDADTYQGPEEGEYDNEGFYRERAPEVGLREQVKGALGRYDDDDESVDFSGFRPGIGARLVRERPAGIILEPLEPPPKWRQPSPQFSPIQPSPSSTSHPLPPKPRPTPLIIRDSSPITPPHSGVPSFQEYPLNPTISSITNPCPPTPLTPTSPAQLRSRQHQILGVLTATTSNSASLPISLPLTAISTAAEPKTANSPILLPPTLPIPSRNSAPAPPKQTTPLQRSRSIGALPRAKQREISEPIPLPLPLPSASAVDPRRYYNVRPPPAIPGAPEEEKEAGSAGSIGPGGVEMI